MKFAEIDGVMLHYHVEGRQDGLCLVFINSLGTDLRIWDEVVSHFGHRFRMVRYDKRGHGLSDCPSGPYSIRDHANDLAGLLTYLKIKETILIGISVGGMIAMNLAARHPEIARALILCDTGTRIGTADMWNQRINTLRQDGMESLGDAILQRWFTTAFAAQRPADYWGYYYMLTRTPVAGYTATCEAIRDADLTDSARMIRTKTLILGGTEDMATPPDLVRELARTLPDARLELIEQAAHLPCIEQPEAMVAAIRRFLQENSLG